MANRKSISKKTRFEVFKRDSFTCQYCGASAPDVLLEVDHIHPVSKGGDNDVLNLLTSCKSCNAGKSDRTIDDSSAVKKQHEQLAALQERREQLEMMLSWRSGLKSIEDDHLGALEDAYKQAIPGWRLNESGLKGARKLLKKYGLNAVLDALETSADRYLVKLADGGFDPASVQLAWDKVGGICAISALPADEQRLFYIKGILNRRLSYVPYDAIDSLKSALYSGVPVEVMEREAKSATSWSRFRDWLIGL